tara:strand:- start:1227 stop:1502 length:276 start_codon:yes stop_codon:yes gene_type:complete
MQVPLSVTLGSTISETIPFSENFENHHFKEEYTMDTYAFTKAFINRIPYVEEINYFSNDTYPLTREEFEQTEKITSEDVLNVINDGDVEVE